MVDEPDGSIRRHIRIHTANGEIEGFLNSSIVFRLLDDMNVRRSFITIHEPMTKGGRWPDAVGPIAIKRDSILFVVELSKPPPRPGNPSAAFEGHFSRARVSVQIGPFSATGMLHVPVGGSAIALLQHESHSFVALTSVFVVGPEGEFETPFLAVNRDSILAVHELYNEGDAGDPEADDS